MVNYLEDVSIKVMMRNIYIFCISLHDMLLYFLHVDNHSEILKFRWNKNILIR